MSHIKNRDRLIGTVAATLAAAITTLARMASFGMMLGGGRDREDSRGSAVGALVMMIFAPLIAMIIQMWISRTREFQADESGAHIAGTPNGLANALLKLERGTKQIPMDVNPATAHMFIVSPLSGGGIARLFSTHPPIEERVERLRKMV
jgi:heat shock protein HtpX